ncbi:hypothetical protein P879_10698 [Paragonimus westermani]|uniref:Dynein heavy chain tail domain-containing protein n=1 Tax=Paragonimus westermani TaxID=34504 RepID=A0A8T0D8B9_9TREM|nr:hypothetical protein P879_10698 [Paragonimus westermani]
MCPFRGFNFSENYIFGKFDVYSNRLNKLVHILDLVDKFTVLTTLKIEGIDAIVTRYKTLCENLKKKNFDGADQMRKEFNKEMDDYKNQFDTIEQELRDFLDLWFTRPTSVERQLDILEKFQQLEFCHLDLANKYALVMKNYAHELDNIRNLYEQQKTDPPVIRNMTPIAGKIYWARHLFKLIDNPMQQFKRRCSDVLWTADGQKCVRQFNKIAAALVEFELLYHHHWCQSIEQVNTGLSSSLLVRDLTTGKLFVNLDLGILELIYETRYLRVLGLTIPAAAQRLLIQEPKFKQRYYTLKELLAEIEEAESAIPAILVPLLRPSLEHLQKALSPGLCILGWCTTNIDDYVNKVRTELGALQLLTKRAADILQCRIEDVLDEMSMTSLCDLPEFEQLSMSDFIRTTEDTVTAARESLSK